MARTPYITGIDIGSNAVRAVLCDVKEGNAISVRGIGQAPSGGVRKGAVVSPEECARSITKAVLELKKSTGVNVQSAFVSLGDSKIGVYASHGVVAVSRADGEIMKEDVVRALDAAETALPHLPNREIVYTAPAYFTVDKDTHIRDPLGLVGVKLEAETLFAVGFSAHIKNLARACEIADVAIDGTVVSSLAVARHVLTRKQMEIGVLLIDFGAQTTSIAVFEEGALLSLDILPIGSGHITYDITFGFQIDLASAERIKKSLGVFLELGKKEVRLSDLPKNFENSFTPKKLQEIVDARLGDIFELVEKHLKKIERSRLLPAGAVLTGGGARLFNIVDVARDELGLPCEIAGMNTGVQGKKELVTGPEWACALGLVRHGMAEDSSGVGGVLRSGFARRIGKFLKMFIP